MNIELLIDSDFASLYTKWDKEQPELLKIEGITKKRLDIFSLANEYCESDGGISIDYNANVSIGKEGTISKSYGNFMFETINPIYKLKGYHDLFISIKENYGLDKAKEVLDSIINGTIYLHNSNLIQIPYCWASSISHLVELGIKDNKQLNSKPPKKRRSYIDMVKEFTIRLAHEVAGAVALADLFIYYSYFVKLEIDEFRKINGLSNNINYVDLLTTKLKKEIEDDFQSLVHTLNMELRTSGQSPFTNFSIFDRPNLELLFGNLTFPDNTNPDIGLIMEIQKIFCDWFSKGDPISGLPYRFPVCTFNIRVDDKQNIIDQESFDYLCDINRFSGCFNIYISSGHKIASCCRLLSSYENQMDSLGNGGVSIGSMRVCTINLARLGHQTNKDTVIDELKKRLDIISIALLSHRKLIEKRISQNFLPFFRNNVMHLNRLFCTIGVNGIYECVKELGVDPISEVGQTYYKLILGYIKNYSVEKSKETKIMFNCEQVPAEQLAIKFADKDHLLLGMNYECYSNQFVPLSLNIDVSERLKLEGLYSSYLIGGSITHINLMEKIQTKEQMGQLLKYAIKCGVEHTAINYNFCKCKNGHITTNKPNQRCSICGEDVEEYTRIIGYFVPKDQFSKGRKHEHNTRQFK